jgi:cyclophilin family peptidyl-prolyl cis-trans isomerase
MRFVLSLVCLLTLVFPVTAGAQEQEKGAAPAAQAEAAAQAGSFNQLFPEWKKLLVRLREIQQEYQIANADTRTTLEKEFNELVAKGEKMAPELIKSAEAAYVASPNENKELAQFLASVAFSSNQNDDYEVAARLGKLLLENKFQAKGLENLAGTAAFEISDYDAAEKYLKQAEAAKTIDQKGTGYLAEIPKYREMWQKEQEVRAAEAKADDLPRVLIKTTKGDITVELFENQAPNTVANFISLVEKDFYNGTPFHRVLQGFMAQGGDPQGTGTGGPGYHIPCECYREDHRKHFRGTLSMAHAGKDTGGSQFFLTFRPTGHLDGRHTVFGRVIDGFDVLAKLKKRDPEKPATGEPDKIVEAKVIRKRDHEYTPKKVGET